MNNFSRILFIVLIIAQTGCSSARQEVRVGTDANEFQTIELANLTNDSPSFAYTSNLKFNSLDLTNRFYQLGPVPQLQIDYKSDKNGLPIYTRNGERYLHPVVYAQQALRQLAGYLKTHNEIYLERAENISSALLSDATISRGAMWFPYRFDFPLHGNATNTAVAPWYSGMAQGQVLSLFSQMFEVTKDKKYFAAATSTFNSLALIGESERPWVSHLVNNFYWIEEYPTPVPDQTLNGFLFSIIGIYDYLQATADPRAVLYLEVSLATIVHELPKFRVPGQISHYCLAHLVQSEKYHKVHIQQLTYLASIANSPELLRWAESLESDN